MNSGNKFFGYALSQGYDQLFDYFSLICSCSNKNHPYVHRTSQNFPKVLFISINFHIVFFNTFLGVVRKTGCKIIVSKKLTLFQETENLKLCF